MRVNSCGFETGDFSEVQTVQGNVSVQSSIVKSGQYALRIFGDATHNGCCDVFALAADGTAVLANVVTSYIRFYFHYAFSLGNTNGVTVMSCRESGGTAKATLSITRIPDGHLALSYLGGITHGTTILADNTWYCLELTIGTGTSASWELKVNGIVDMSGTNNLTANNAALWRFGTINNYDVSVDMYYDDIAIDADAYPGPGSIVRLDPAADVAKTNWLNQAASSTNEFQSVAGHDTDTTYVVTSTSGTQTFTVSFPALSTRQIIGTINELKFLAWARDTGTALTSQIQVKPASNAITTISSDVGSTYAIRSLLYKASGGTDALTIANVNTCQASIIKTQSQARELRCTCMVLMLDLPGVFSPAPNILQAVKRAAFW